MSQPWDKNRITPEAERLVAQNRAERNLERSFPKKWWHDVTFGWGGAILLLALASSAAFTVYSLWGILS
ncbi:hypothetical protein [Stenotrophomonas maltophilia]|uniref:hypothetical protein n=1 Tax=Stenotrophomonas maltophilia TaxID=40324 RepID=UPI00123A7AE7|nr:hypothetical protein [Stenotrophomonas maltophilia]QEU34141.1 hypothetical protein FOB57_13810 [Stenotrophomonas maltophilia]